ncbi:MAG: hypothetical protein ACI9WU_002296 [Myxococcota bacterium]
MAAFGLLACATDTPEETVDPNAVLPDGGKFDQSGFADRVEGLHDPIAEWLRQTSDIDEDGLFFDSSYPALDAAREQQLADLAMSLALRLVFVAGELAQASDVISAEHMGQAGVGDIDADGFPDLYLGGEGLGRLYRNQGAEAPGIFEDVTTLRGIPVVDDVRQALFVDQGLDGDQDLILIRSGGASQVLLQAPDGQFASTPLATHRGAHAATLLDADNDGDLDLYVGYYGSDSCNRARCTANLPSMDGRNGTANQLFIRQPDGSLTADDQPGDTGWALAAAAADLNGDGHQDLYLANDFGPNALLLANGRGQFVDVGSARHVADRGSGMNVSLADVNDDGRWDLFVTNIDMFEKSVKVVFQSGSGRAV